MKNISILLFLVFSYSITAQNAEFSADLDKLSQFVKHNDELYKKALEWEWIINGKKLSFGSETVKIKPNNSKLDTILFRKNENSKYDTIVCNISNPFKYNFEYNTCCEFFNVRTLSDQAKTKPREKRIVSFEISNNKENKKYLGIIGESGIIIKEENKEYSLFYTCTSAMSSNIYGVSINEVEVCKEDVECRQLSCIFENNRFQVPYAESDFKILTKKIDFLYLPLGIESLNISLDLKSNRLKIKSTP